jgi:hypothetical protein
MKVERNAADFVHTENSGAGFVSATDTGGVVAAAWNVITSDWNGSNIHLWRNGTLKATTAVAAISSTGTLNDVGVEGISSIVFWNGDIAEVLVYNNALSSTNRGNVETYLKSKYGIP